MRRFLFVLAALFVAGFLTFTVGSPSPSQAAPPTNKPTKSPKPTITPTPTPTATTTSPTPAPTATTASPTPTAACAPITITSGGTYTGCYESTNVSVPAVQINTADAVILSHATVRHKGQGISACCNYRANLTVRDTTFLALDPGTPAHQQDLYAYAPTAVTLENNSLTNSHGILINGANQATNPLKISRNDFVNLGRYNEAECCNGAVHFDKVSAPNGGSISWNRVTNTYGQSLTEDVIGIYQSNGASGNPLMFDHNLINGSYPASGDGASFTGTCINLGDDFGTWQTGDSNTAVNCTNIGIAVAFQTTGGNITQTNSTTVSDGLAGISDSGPRVSSSFGNGVNSAGGNATGPIVITNNKSGQRRWNGSAWESVNYYIPDATTASGNTDISPVNAAAEQAAVDAWEASRASASVAIGPRP